MICLSSSIGDLSNRVWYEQETEGEARTLDDFIFCNRIKMEIRWDRSPEPESAVQRWSPRDSRSIDSRATEAPT